MKIIEFLLLVLAVCLTTHVFAMQQITVNTGYGYFSYNGQIVSDYVYAPGNYVVCNGLVQNEVSNKSMLNAQQVNGMAYEKFLNNEGCN